MNRIKIMIVDDDQDILNLLKLNIDNEKFKVYLESNAFRASRAIALLEPEVIILDWHFERSLGDRVLERAGYLLNTHKGAKALPYSPMNIITFSSTSEKEISIVESPYFQSVGHLDKSLDLFSLKNQLQNYLLEVQSRLEAVEPLVIPRGYKNLYEEGLVFYSKNCTKNTQSLLGHAVFMASEIESKTLICEGIDSKTDLEQLILEVDDYATLFCEADDFKQNKFIHLVLVSKSKLNSDSSLLILRSKSIKSLKFEKSVDELMENLKTNGENPSLIKQAA